MAKKNLIETEYDAVKNVVEGDYTQGWAIARAERDEGPGYVVHVHFSPYPVACWFVYGHVYRDWPYRPPRTRFDRDMDAEQAAYGPFTREEREEYLDGYDGECAFLRLALAKQFLIDYARWVLKGNTPLMRPGVVIARTLAEERGEATEGNTVEDLEAEARADLRAFLKGKGAEWEAENDVRMAKNHPKRVN